MIWSARSKATARWDTAITVRPARGEVLPQQHLGLDVDGARQVVEHDQLGRVHQRPCRRQALALPAGQAQTRAARSAWPRRRASPARRRRSPPPRGRGRSPPCPSGRGRRCRAPSPTPTAAPATGTRRSAGRGTRRGSSTTRAVPAHLAGDLGLPRQPEDRPQQRRLAGADGAGDHGEAAPLGGERDRPDRLARSGSAPPAATTSRRCNGTRSGRTASGRLPCCHPSSGSERRLTVLLDVLVGHQHGASGRTPRRPACAGRAPVRPSAAGS